MIESLAKMKAIIEAQDGRNEYNKAWKKLVYVDYALMMLDRLPDPRMPKIIETCHNYLTDVSVLIDEMDKEEDTDNDTTQFDERELL